jgi:serine/threonine protein kinase
MPTFIRSLMNGPGHASGNDDAGQSAPVPEIPSLTADAEPSPNNRPVIPDYDLLRRIGHGAYGDVWLARSQATGALRAAKIVWRHTFEDAKPFQREFAGIQCFERISREHPSQLALFHIGRNEPAGYFYYVMELADAAESRSEDGGLRMENGGKSEPTAGHPRSSIFDPRHYTPHTLRADLEKGRLPAAKVLEIGLALSEALSHLHANGLVHRDVKPSNVIFVNGRPKLADIGLVTDASDQCSIVGTEGYLPPEGPGTPQADIFALGKVLYEAATGLDRRKFPDFPNDIRTWPDATQTFEMNEIILKACMQDAKARYQTCDELHADLALLSQGKSVRQKRSRQWFWSVGKKSGLALSALAIVAALISFIPHQSNRSEPSNDGSDSTNLEANALCDKGMYILRGDDFMQIAAAYTNFNRAIALDPNFARPYVGLLEIYVRDSAPGVPVPTLEMMRAIARRLEKLAPHLAATYVAQAVVNWSDLNYPEAERCMLKAIKANPDYELDHTFYSWLLCCFDRPDEAYKQVQISQTLAPSKSVIYRQFGNVYYAERDYTNAITWYRKTLEWEPHHPHAFKGIGDSLQAMGDYTNALDYHEKADILFGNDETSTKQGYNELRRALAEGGIRGYWQLQWKWTEKNTNSDFYWKGQIQIHLGNTNAALGWLQKSYDKHEQGDDFDAPLNQLLFDDCWDGLHDDPRFKHLLDEIGFTKVML